jgi:hypothetical protein
MWWSQGIELVPCFILATNELRDICNIYLITTYQCDAELGEVIEKTGSSVEHQL